MGAGYITRTPRKKTALIVAEIQRILAEDFADILPVTARQIFYRLVASDHIGKDQDARFYDILTRARRARLVAFEAITDAGQTLRPFEFMTNPEKAIEMVQNYLCGDSYALDRQQGQRRRLYLICEAAGMVPQLARIAHPYGVDVISGGGQPSVTCNYELAQRITAEAQSGAVVLHVGDHDPGGLIIYQSVRAT